MAKFVEWANSLLLRFEEQVRLRRAKATNEIFQKFSDFPRCRMKNR